MGVDGATSAGRGRGWEEAQAQVAPELGREAVDTRPLLTVPHCTMLPLCRPAPPCTAGHPLHHHHAEQAAAATSHHRRSLCGEGAAAAVGARAGAACTGDAAALVLACCCAACPVTSPAPALSTPCTRHHAQVWLKFPREGSGVTPPHPSNDFKWKDYCPTAFKCAAVLCCACLAAAVVEARLAARVLHSRNRAPAFAAPTPRAVPAESEPATHHATPRHRRSLRGLFGIDNSQYILSCCGDQALREMPSPGKSGRCAGQRVG